MCVCMATIPTPNVRDGAFDYGAVRSDGQYENYPVLPPEERAKGFVRPVRRSYRHLTCRVVTSMGMDLAETFARDPGYYTHTFCTECGQHFPVSEFVWKDSDDRVGS
jgi:hypothetical protein